MMKQKQKRFYGSFFSDTKLPHSFVPQIGVLGSSESSKKALIFALLRLIEPTGVVRIDGLKITDIGLYDLRSKMIVVSQVKNYTLFVTQVSVTYLNKKNHNLCYWCVRS